MTNIIKTAAIVIALSTGAMATAANAAPTYGISVDGGQVNPFAAVNGR